MVSNYFKICLVDVLRDVQMYFLTDSQKGIALHKILFYSNKRGETKARRKKWTDFVKLKLANWNPSANNRQ